MKERIFVSGAELASDYALVDTLGTTHGNVNLHEYGSFYAKRHRPEEGLVVVLQKLWKRLDHQIGDACWLEEVTDADQEQLGKEQWDKTMNVGGVGV